MTENLTKLPVKSILRKSSLTFIEHDDSEIQISLETEKPTKIKVETLETPPKEYPGETEEEKARREEFEMKRKMNRHQEAMKVQIAKKLLQKEDGIEEESDIQDETISDASEDALENTQDEDENDYYYASADEITDESEQKTKSAV